AMRIAAVLYLPVFAIDALTSSLIRASAHLLFFIAFYQAIDEKAREARNQRLLVVFLLFVTSLATSTHQTILLFVIVFTVVMFVRLIRASAEDSAAAVGAAALRRPAVRAALAFTLPTALIAALLFPALPRTQNPMVRGIRTGLESAATGISDTIDFRGERRISGDPMAVARVWMPRDAVPFFTPLRLRANVYDAWQDDRWVQTLRRTGEIVDGVDGHIALARPAAFSRGASIEQKTIGGKLLLPEGTFDIAGFDHLYVIEPYGTARHPNFVNRERVRGEVRFDVVMSREIRPLLARPAPVVEYPITPQVRALAMQIARNARTDREKAAVVATYLERNYAFIPDPADLGRTYTVEEFLLSVKRGHCEYFAAGMVVLLTALDVPARIVGGFYGGELNPLIGSFIVRQKDAHAWVEVFDGVAWRTYDPTPAALRPGNSTRSLVRAYASALADSIAYFWDRYILTFGSSDQVALLARGFFAARDAWQQLRLNMADTAIRARENAGRIVLFAAA
ncbi:MAG TPA: transglutaminaseTgpA domain-containing protein, partial [Thermoanaerobaculia bacterium]|nr:transglutaminaseTgpA domain-containing protein [Thermoanaerobaculia bacterium]